MHEMESQFMELPVEVRAKFNHSFQEFLASSGEPDFLEKLGFSQSVSASASVPESVPEGGTAE